MTVPTAVVRQQPHFVRMADARALNLGPSEKEAGILTIPAATTGVINANLKKSGKIVVNWEKEKKKNCRGLLQGHIGSFACKC